MKSNLFKFGKKNFTETNRNSSSSPINTNQEIHNLTSEELAKLSEEELKEYYIYKFVPERVRLEASTICQLRCAGCSFQRGGEDDLGRGFLSIDNFIKFCEMNPFIHEIELSNYGEIFLNPDLIAMMHYAKEKNITLLCRNGSNFNTVSDEQIQALVETGFKEILLSIDGASQETYAKYRIGGDFNKVIENVKKLQSLKEKTGSKYPLLKWQYILMEHNELEIGKAKAMAKELNIPIKFKYNWDELYVPIHREYITKETGLVELTRAEYLAKYKISPFNSMCEQIFVRPQVNWDGRLLGCCTRKYAPFAINVFDVGLIEAIRSPQYIKAKECLLTIHPSKEQYGSCICFNCTSRTQREAEGIVLKLK